MHPGVSVCNVGTSLRDVSLVIKTLSKRAESTSLQLGGYATSSVEHFVSSW